jgi:hypothetical protein
MIINEASVHSRTDASFTKLMDSDFKQILLQQMYRLWQSYSYLQK